MATLTLTAALNNMPVRDQAAFRLLGYMLSGGTLPDADVAVDAAYRYADAFLERARANYRAAQAAARGDADAADEEPDHGPTQPA